jgi:hypothetical protein
MASDMDTWFLGDVLKWREFGGTAWSVAFNTGAVSVLLAALLTIQTPAGMKFTMIFFSKGFLIMMKI